jgi:hypothetical protein
MGWRPPENFGDEAGSQLFCMGGSIMRLLKNVLVGCCRLIVAGIIAFLPLRDASAQVSTAKANKEFNNPASSVPFLIFENDLLFLDGDVVPAGKDPWANVTVFEPLLPFAIGNTGWTSINRPIIPFVGHVDVPGFQAGGVDGGPGGAAGGGGIVFDDKAGLADITFFSLLKPPSIGGFTYAFGPTFKFPTATSSVLGSEKWQAGPAAVALYSTPKFTMGVLAQHWWDYAGKSSRADVSVTNIQYFYSYTLSPQWSIAAGPIIVINHEAKKGDKYLVPVGIGLAKAFKLGDLNARFLVEGDYYVKQFDTYGPEYNVRAVLGIMVPDLFKVFKSN